MKSIAQLVEFKSKLFLFILFTSTERTNTFPPVRETENQGCHGELVVKIHPDWFSVALGHPHPDLDLMTTTQWISEWSMEV